MTTTTCISLVPRWPRGLRANPPFAEQHMELTVHTPAPLPHLTESKA